MLKTRRQILKSIAAAPVTAIGASTAHAASSPTTHIVTIKEFRFHPETLNILVGDTVEWRNIAGFLHTATSDEAGLFDTKIIRTGRSKSHLFEAEGEVSYHCEVYPMMKAKIIINR